MTVERRDPQFVLGESEESVRRFIESDFRIRSGLCPNGHGLMNETNFGQECPQCGFFCNTRAERDTSH